MSCCAPLQPLSLYVSPDVSPAHCLCLSLSLPPPHSCYKVAYNR